jgi:hypothetical protein
MSISTRSLAGLLCVGLLGASGGALADVTEAEVEHILTRVGRSQCVFVRNGREHPAADAESHLRMKYRKGARYVDSTEDFIERLASSSSWTKDPYQIRCPGQTETTASVWLHSMLRDYRRTPPGHAPSL